MRDHEVFSQRSGQSEPHKEKYYESSGYTWQALMSLQLEKVVKVQALLCFDSYYSTISVQSENCTINIVSTILLWLLLDRSPNYCS